MNARATPNSSLAATPRPPAWRCRNSAIGADRAPQAPLEMEKMEVSHRLAHGEKKLMRVELAAKQRIEHVCRRFGRIASFMQLREPQAVVLLELRDALAQTPEGQPVRGQRERC